MKKQINPFEGRDLHEQLRFPKMSWSSISAWEWNKEEWYQRYYLGIRGESNSAMEAGRIIGERLATDKKYLPEVKRPGVAEYMIHTKFNDIDILGHLDFWDSKTKTLTEIKTTQNKKRWTVQSVKDHGQISFYALLLFLKHDIRPDELKINLVSIPVQMEGDFEVRRSKEPIQIFETKRTMMEVLEFGVKIKKTFGEMKAFIHSKEVDL